MNIIFFGASRFVLPVIELIKTHFDLALVLTTESEPTDAVPLYCQANGISYLSVKKFDQTTKQAIQDTHPTLGVLGYFGIILPQEVLDLFPQGILNIHPSLLPKYRGATPVQSAIANGDTETGVSIIKLDKEMDHGPILAQEKKEILLSDTTETLHDKLFTKGAQMLQAIIPDYLAGKIVLHPQDDALATYTKRSLARQDGYIDIENPPAADELDRMIRAYYPWPGVWGKLKTKTIKLLPEKRIQMEGKKPVSVKDFTNGYPETKETILRLFGDHNS